MRSNGLRTEFGKGGDDAGLFELVDDSHRDCAHGLRAGLLRELRAQQSSEWGPEDWRAEGAREYGETYSRRRASDRAK